MSGSQLSTEIATEASDSTAVAMKFEVTTLPGSPASIQFGEGGTTMMTEPLQRLLLIVEDVKAARAVLISRGVDVSEIFHNEPGKGPMPGGTGTRPTWTLARPAPRRRRPPGRRPLLSHGVRHEH